MLADIWKLISQRQVAGDSIDGFVMPGETSERGSAQVNVKGQMWNNR